MPADNAIGRWISLRETRKIRKSLERDKDLKAIKFPFSKGWAFQAESYGGIRNVYHQTEHTLSARQFEKAYTANASSYWLRTGSSNFPHLDLFVDKILPLQKKPFTLYSSDGDLSVPLDANPRSVDAVLRHPHFVRWYSQNAVVQPQHKHQLKPIPIGLDLHTPRVDGIGSRLYNSFRAIATAHEPFESRNDQIFVDIHLNYSDDLRREVAKIIKNNPAFRLLDTRISQVELWRCYRAHKYVLSLIGNGLDCHRTWEALGLGCRVVTISSPLDEMLRKFPVYIASNSSELADTQIMSNLEDYFASSHQFNTKISFDLFR